MTSSGKNLILITNHFPYGSGEPFLKSEIEFLVKAFEKVIVITKDVESVECRFTAPSCVPIRVNRKSSSIEKIESVFLFLKHLKKCCSYVIEEIHLLKSTKKEITLAIAKKAFHDLLKALILAKQIQKAITSEKISGSVVLYSYWFTSSALATTFVSVKGISMKRVSRAHGSDLYPELHSGQYLAFRKLMASTLNKIFPISEFGARRLNDLLPSDLAGKKIIIARLGTPMPKKIPLKRKSEAPLLVSCSNMVSLKRIHLIIEALSLIKNIPIRWSHFGDGPLKEELSGLASLKLKHIGYQFHGAIKNSEVIQFYEDHFIELFINTSESEGIPVSIMEAQSFGIPCIATDAGGNREIVSTETGELLSKESTPLEIAKSIQKLLLLGEDQKEVIRKNCFANWKTRYNANLNFSNFANQLVNL